MRRYKIVRDGYKSPLEAKSWQNNYIQVIAQEKRAENR